MDNRLERVSTLEERSFRGRECPFFFRLSPEVIQEVMQFARKKIGDGATYRQALELWFKPPGAK